MKFSKLFGLWVLLAVVMPAAAQSSIVDRALLDTILGIDRMDEDFQSFYVANDTSVSLNVLSLDETTIARGQGPDLVSDGAVYIAEDTGSLTSLQWYGHDRLGLQTRTLTVASYYAAPKKLTISYTEPVQAMGLDLLDFEEYQHQATVTVYDEAEQLIDQVMVDVVGADPVFFGYQADSIGSVVIESGERTWGTIIDNHAFTYPHHAPEPSLWMMIIGGVALLTIRRN